MLNYYIAAMFSASRATYKLHSFCKRAAYTAERHKMALDTGRRGRASAFVSVAGDMPGSRINLFT